VVHLRITSGPHAGKEFVFQAHDTFLVGRSGDAHLKLNFDDPYFSRRHFLIEVNPPRCRVLDLNSRNGIYLRGQRILAAEIHDGDEVKAGHTIFKFALPPLNPDQVRTLDLPAETAPSVEPASQTIDHVPPGLPQIPGFRLGPELGRGAMGVVYRATRLADNHTVALKTVAPGAGTSQRQLERFLREARVLAELKHPNIVAHLDSGVVGDMVYLVMEYISGADGAKLLNAKGALKIPLAVRMTCQLLSGLAHAHRLGFVHRDIKPSNILVGGDKGKKTAKLADFGLARAYDECHLSGLTFQGEVGGTPAFMAPEQVTHFRDVKPAADQYSAAATLYNLLTRAYPFTLPKDIGQQLAIIITGSIVPIRQRRPEIPEALAAIIERGLAREPGDRFADVTEFRTALLPFAK
jgi:serine/threonine protein kinase